MDHDSSARHAVTCRVDGHSLPTWWRGLRSSDLASHSVRVSFMIQLTCQEMPLS